MDIHCPLQQRLGHIREHQRVEDMHRFASVARKNIRAQDMLIGVLL
jgi:hypothetical protein